MILQNEMQKTVKILKQKLKNEYGEENKFNEYDIRKCFIERCPILGVLSIALFWNFIGLICGIAGLCTNKSPDNIKRCKVGIGMAIGSAIIGMIIGIIVVCT